jgi:hypothetical protein
LQQLPAAGPSNALDLRNDERRVNSPRQPYQFDESDPVEHITPTALASTPSTETKHVLAEEESHRGVVATDGGERKEVKPASSTAGGELEKSQNGEDEWETHQIVDDSMRPTNTEAATTFQYTGGHVNATPNVNIIDNSKDDSRNIMISTSPPKTTFNNIQYKVDNGKSAKLSSGESPTSSNTTVNTNASSSTSPSVTPSNRINLNTAITPSKPTPLYYDYAVKRQNWYWAMQDRVLRFTPDHIQRLDAGVVKEVHAYKEITRIEVSNVDKTKFIMWYAFDSFCISFFLFSFFFFLPFFFLSFFLFLFGWRILIDSFEKDESISSEHYFIDEKEREQLLRVCVDFAKKQSPPHSIPIARVG